jgi:hypothetical protein
VKRQTSLTMRSLMLLRAVVITSCGLTLVPAVFAGDVATVATTTAIAPVEQTKDEKSETRLLNKAVRVIQRTMKRANGKPYFVTCQYKIKDNKPVAASTEVHYLDYRKKSDARSVEFTRIDGKLDRVVEFVYKPNNKTLAVVERDPINNARRLTTRRVSLDI